MQRFFDTVRARLFGGRMSQKQVDGCLAILRATEGLPTSHRAYLLATVYHETAKTMQPIQQQLYSPGRDETISRDEIAVFLEGPISEMLALHSGFARLEAEAFERLGPSVAGILDAESILEIRCSAGTYVRTLAAEPARVPPSRTTAACRPTIRSSDGPGTSRRSTRWVTATRLDWPSTRSPARPSSTQGLTSRHRRERTSSPLPTGALSSQAPPADTGPWS